MNILITGGAGYIGSNTAFLAKSLGHKVTVLDNLSSGNISHLPNVDFIQTDLNSINDFSLSMKGRKFDAIIHFAAKSIVSESSKYPDKYYQNNLIGTLNLINYAIANNIKKFIFSSTASVYGAPISIPIKEEHPLNPINVYGHTKKIIEEILFQYSKLTSLSVFVLRYFNAAGAEPKYSIGENHKPETHLIPNLFDSLQNKEAIHIFGNQYNTPDGTCIRDYVHISDIARAHLSAIDSLDSGERFKVCNLGSGNGSSVLDVLNLAEEISGLKAKIVYAEPREGDPPILIADISNAKKLINWTPEYSLRDILNSAWNWHQIKKDYD